MSKCMFNLFAQRNSVYYVHVYVLPAVLLAILVPFQFFLPPDSQERLTIGWYRMCGVLAKGGSGQIENTVGKEEIARNEQFLLFQLCFLPVWVAFYHFRQI